MIFLWKRILEQFIVNMLLSSMLYSECRFIFSLGNFRHGRNVIFGLIECFKLYESRNELGAQ